MKRYKRLEETDRVSIQVLTKRGYSDAHIAREIGVHRASVSRERRRNTVDGKYYHHLAQGLADKRLRASRWRKSKVTPEIIAFVEEKLRLGWSPQQISGWMKHRQSNRPSATSASITTSGRTNGTVEVFTVIFVTAVAVTGAMAQGSAFQTAEKAHSRPRGY